MKLKFRNFNLSGISILLVFLLFLPVKAYSQKLAEGKYWISLADKTGSNFSLSKPTEFLSPRALERRAKQNIPLTEEDLPVNQKYIDSLEHLGLKIIGTSRWFNAVIVETADSRLIDSLEYLGFVSDLEYSAYGKKASGIRGFSKKPVLTLEKFAAGSTFNFGLSLPQITILNGDILHNAGYRGAGMHIAVIDGGFYGADTISAFDSLWNEGRVLGYRDFSRSPLSFFSTASHGMSVLSTMAANVPGKIIGTAPKASYWLLKSEIVESETRFEEALWVLAAEFADSVGADIINSSLGYSVFDDPSGNYSYSDMDGKTSLVTRAADKAFSKGMIVVSSAGNEGNKSWKYITAPADGKNVLAVGATDTSGLIAAFSSIGPSSDLRVKPDVMAVGQRTIVVASSGAIAEGNGTSFSSPQIAGLVACLWEAAPERTNSEIISSIKRSSSLYFNSSAAEGYGIPDFQAALILLKTPVSGERIIAAPNPSKGSFEIRSDSIFQGEVSITIFNSMGKKVFTGSKDFSFGYATIDELENQSSGIYFIHVKTKENQYYLKVIIQ